MNCNDIRDISFTLSNLRDKIIKLKKGIGIWRWNIIIITSNSRKTYTSLITNFFLLLFLWQLRSSRRKAYLLSSLVEGVFAPEVKVLLIGVVLDLLRVVLRSVEVVDVGQRARACSCTRSWQSSEDSRRRSCRPWKSACWWWWRQVSESPGLLIVHHPSVVSLDVGKHPGLWGTEAAAVIVDHSLHEGEESFGWGLSCRNSEHVPEIINKS